MSFACSEFDQIWGKCFDLRLGRRAETKDSECFGKRGYFSVVVFSKIKVSNVGWELIDWLIKSWYNNVNMN